MLEGWSGVVLWVVDDVVVFGVFGQFDQCLVDGVEYDIVGWEFGQLCLKDCQVDVVDLLFGSYYYVVWWCVGLCLWNDVVQICIGFVFIEQLIFFD